MKKCLNPNCTRKSLVRGLCMQCYTQAARLVRLKRTTWDKLVKTGRCHASNNDTGVSGWLLGKSE